jgi:hypothetical protein
LEGRNVVRVLRRMKTVQEAPSKWTTCNLGKWFVHFDVATTISVSCSSFMLLAKHLPVFVSHEVSSNGCGFGFLVCSTDFRHCNRNYKPDVRARAKFKNATLEMTARPKHHQSRSRTKNTIHTIYPKIFVP